MVTKLLLEDPTGDGYLGLTGGTDTNAASTPDHADFAITGDIDLRFLVALDDWTGAAASQLLGQQGNSGGNASWRFYINTSGQMAFTWSVGGLTYVTTKSAAASGTDGVAKWLRVTFDVDNGAAGSDAKFYTSTDPVGTAPASVTWTQVGTTQTTAGTTSIFNSTDDVNIGGGPGLAGLVGKMYYAEIRNGIAGTIVASPDYRTGSSNTVVDSQGKTWSLEGTATRYPEVTGDAYLLEDGSGVLLNESSTAGELVTPTTAALVIATFAPSIALPQTVTPTTLALTLATFAPVIKLVVTPTTLAFTLATFAPTVTASVNQLVTPTTLALILAPFAPTVTATVAASAAEDDFSDDQTDTWASADSGGAWTLVGTAANFDKASGVGTIVTAAGSTRYAYLGEVSVANANVVARVRVGTAPTDANVSLLARTVDQNNTYMGGVYFETNSTVTTLIAKRVSSTETDIAFNANQGNYLANEYWFVRFEATGTTLRVRVWKDGNSEPTTWNTSTTDSALTAPDGVGVRVYNPSGSSLTVGWNDFTALGPVVVVPSTAALILAPFAPTVTASNNQSVTPTTLALALTTFAPTVTATANVTVTPTTAALTLATFAPSVTASNHQLVTPTTASLATTTFAPVVRLVVTPTTAALTLTTFAPTVTASDNKLVTPMTASLTTAAFTPTVTATAHQTVTPTTASRTLSSFAPTVTTTANQLVTPTTAALSLTTNQPSVTTGDSREVVPDAAALTLTTFAPTVTAIAAVVVTPTTASLTLTTFAPTVSATGHQVVTPTTAALIATRFAPVVTATAHVSVTPTTKALTLTTFAPAAVIGYRVTPTTASLTTSSFAPTLAISNHALVIPGTVPLVLTTYVPFVEGVAPSIAIPPPPSLVLTPHLALVAINPPFEEMHGVLVQNDTHGGVLVVTGPHSGATMTQTRGRTTLIVTTPRYDGEIESN